MSWVIREYKQNDLGGCQQLMASNTPRYFDPSEVDEFTEDLHKREAQSAAQRWPYFVLVTNQLVRACGGYVIFPDNTACFGAWWERTNIGRGWAVSYCAIGWIICLFRSTP